MKGPDAKILYHHVLDELGKGLPGGQEKVKGTQCWIPISRCLIAQTEYLEQWCKSIFRTT